MPREARASTFAAGSGDALALRAAPIVFLLFWSAGYPFAKIILKYAEPLTALALRYLIVAAIMAVIALVVRPRMPASLAQWGHMLVSSALLQIGYFGCCWYAFWLGASSGTVALILSLQPIIISILAPALVGEKVGGWQWVGLALGVAGAATVIVARLELEALSWLELALILAALVTITGATLYEKRFVAAHHPVAVSLIQHLVGVGGTTWLAVALETCQIQWTAEFSVSLAWFVVCNSLIAVSLLLYMVQKGEAARVSALFFLVPPTAALLSWMMLGETLPLLAWPGMAVAGLGVLLATRKPRLLPRVAAPPLPPPPRAYHLHEPPQPGHGARRLG
ncbi:MAG: DMT family transporter [Hyphomicrobiaceae bacterium]|nr:DMT family transporter [Hyphomicrobiaceae bacterium]